MILSFTYVEDHSGVSSPNIQREKLRCVKTFVELQEKSGSPQNHAYTSAPGEMGDNTGHPSIKASSSLQDPSQVPMDVQQQYQPSGLFISSPEDPWHLTFNELKVMRARIGTLENVEAATLEFAKQLQSITTRTTTAEANISRNSDEINALKEEMAKLRDTVYKQQETIDNLHKVKEDFSKTSHKRVSEMNKLLEQQKHQVESLKVIKKNIETNAQQQTEQLQAFEISHKESQEFIQQQIQNAAHDAEQKSMTGQAFQNRHNIIITGIPEQENTSTYSEALNFFKSNLKIRKRLSINTAHRLGRSPSEESSYIRPILVKFHSLTDRNLVWKMRKEIHAQEQEDQQRIKIQADIPKKLRDGMATMYRVVKAASGMAEFNSATIKDYAISLHDKQYMVDQLETLPPPIRPSSLAVRESDEALVFFSKHCFLSNHFPSTFTTEGHTFYTMEHFLAFKRAELSQKDNLIQRALQARDPVESKSILNLLRKDHPHEWETIRRDVATCGIREKFCQNPHLANLLKDTHQLKLGEASKNPAWGIGLTLEDPQILDTSHWNESGNLLGSVLMQIRAELTSIDQ